MKYQDYEHTDEDGNVTTIRAHKVTAEEVNDLDPIVTTGGTVTPNKGDVVIDTGSQFADVLPGDVFDGLGYTEVVQNEPGGAPADPDVNVTRAEFDALLDRVTALENPADASPQPGPGKGA